MPDDGWLGASVGEREEMDAALPLTAPVHVVNMYPGTKRPARGYEGVPVDPVSWISTIFTRRARFEVAQQPFHRTPGSSRRVTICSAPLAAKFRHT